MLILSHRGYHRSCPENTLEAFEQAVAIGVDGIETDIRLDANGVPILFHDRIAPTGAPVASLTREELSEFVGYPVPPLESALDSFSQPLWNLEIKESAGVANTLSVLDRFHTSRRILVTSFNHQVVGEVAQRAAVDVGLIVAHRPIETVKLADWFSNGAGPRFIVWEFGAIDRALVESAAAQGIQSLVYGVVTREEHESVLEWDPYALITDHPELLIGIHHKT
jgi:glycerophosphoryl diester phosphodiesterase